MSWFKRENNEIEATAEKRVRTEGLWVKCDDCRQVIWKKDLDANWNVCTKCERHFRIDSHERLALLLDGGEPGTDRDDFYQVFDFNLQSTDPLKFTDTRAYKDRLKQTQASTGLKDAVVNAEGKLNGRDVSSARWSIRSSAAAWARWSAKPSPGPSNAPPNNASL